MYTGIRIRISFSLLAVLLVLCLCAAAGAEADRLPLMQFHQAAIGSSNCHILIAGDTVILVDGGTDTDVDQTPDVMLAYVAASGIDHIDAHFVTHYHNDHSMQLDDFSRDYGTDATVVYGPSEQLPERFLPLPNGSYRQIVIGDEVDVGPFHVLCVGPREVGADGRINRDSLNLVITYGTIRILITGDYVGGQLREQFRDQTANMDIFVFPHHGLEPFVVGELTLRMLNPSLVLVPGSGRGAVYNYFNSNHMSPVIRSAADGNLVVLSDGVDWQLYEDVAPGAFADLDRTATAFPAPEDVKTSEKNP